MSRASGIQLAIGALYLALAVLTGLSWEPAHDEGITWYQTLGRIQIDAAPAQPVAVQSLYHRLDGGDAHSAAQLIDALMEKSGMHPPGYYLGLRWWTALVGTNRILLVLPIYVLGLACVFLLGGIARRLIPGPHCGEWTMLLFALSPWFVAYSNLARPYAWVLELMIVSTALALRLAEPASGSARTQAALRAGFVLVSALGVLSLYHYGFVVAWQLAFLAAAAWTRSDRSARLRQVVLLAVAIALGFGVWAPNFFAHLQTTGSAESYFSGFPPVSDWPALSARLLTLFALGGAVQSVVAGIAVPAFAALGVLTLVAGLRSLRMTDHPAGIARIFWWSLPLLPSSIAMADWLHGTHTLFVTKTSFALLPLLLLATVRATAGLPERWRRLALGAWALLFAVSLFGDLHARAAGSNPMEQVAEAIALRDEPAHVMVLPSTFPGSVVPLLLELRSAEVEQVRIVHAPWFGLDAAIDSFGRDQSIERLTFVNLDVPYSPAGTWQPEHLAQLRERAAERGWRIESPSGPEIEAGAGRILAITPPVPVRYFAF